MQNQINLKEKSVIELKALAYDLLSAVNNAQQNLQIVNNELTERANQESSPKVDPLPVVEEVEVS